MDWDWKTIATIVSLFFGGGLVTQIANWLKNKGRIEKEREEQEERLKNIENRQDKTEEQQNKNQEELNKVLYNVGKSINQLEEKIDDKLEAIIKISDESDKKICEETALLKKGQQMNLRNTLTRQHEQYTERGYITAEQKRDWLETYDSYHSLGANGVIDGLKEDIINLRIAAKVEFEKGDK